MQNKIKILFLSANPRDQNPLRLDKEMRDIQQALRDSKNREKFELIRLSALRIDDLKNALLEYKPNYIHFAGHGEENGIALLNDKTDKTQIVSSEPLSQLFNLFSTDIYCVFLNSCYSEAQANLIHCYNICVIGMKKQVHDNTAIEFAKSFYQGIFAENDIGFSFELAKTSVGLSGLPGSDIPVLLPGTGKTGSVKNKKNFWVPIIVVFAIAISGILLIFVCPDECKEYKLILHNESDTYTIAKNECNKFGFVDTKDTAKVIVELKYDSVIQFSEGLAAVMLDKKWGFVNDSDSIIIKPQYDSVLNYKEGMAGVCLKGKWGFIDKKGDVIIPLLLNKVREFANNFAAVWDTNKVGYFIDKKGNMVSDYNLNLVILIDPVDAQGITRGYTQSYDKVYELDLNNKTHKLIP